MSRGNKDSDWAMWEDSVMEQDSQTPSQFRDTVPSSFPVEEQAATDSYADVFSKVDKHAP